MKKWAIIDIHDPQKEVVAMYDCEQEADFYCKRMNDEVEVFISFTDWPRNMVSCYRVFRLAR